MQQQLTIDFESGLVDQYPEYKDCIRAVVYGCGRQFKAVAADMDYSPSKLSRMLADNPDDKLNLPAFRLPDLIDATNGLDMIHWLVERYLEPADAKRERAVSVLTTLLPQIEKALSDINK